MPPPELRKRNRSRARSHAALHTSRLPWLDTLRGTAVLAMIAYHFCFDLNYLGWLHQDLNHDFRWQLARSLILGSFLFCVGAGLVLAEQQKTSLRSRWWRIGKITAAALLVSLGSRLMFPQTFIWFGVLHAIVVMSLLIWGLQKAGSGPLVTAGLAIVALAAGNGLSHPWFSLPALGWIGLMPQPPNTEDYVPLLPWFGVCLAGHAFMSWHLQAKPRVGVNTAAKPTATRISRGLHFLGQHSLPIYLLHQPVLLGGLIPLTQMLRGTH